MSMFFGVIGAIILIGLICRFIWFLLKIGRHAARDLSDYANAEPYNRKDHAALIQTSDPSKKILITDADRSYFADHVPASAKTDPRRRRR